MKIKLSVILLLILLLGISRTLQTYAASSVHVRILGPAYTIFYGDVPLSGCNVKDESGTSHNYLNPLAVCALDSASKSGNFTYDVKDLGGNLGLSVDRIGEVKSASDSSTYWLNDVNGQAEQGVSNLILKDGDRVFFHFFDPNANLIQRAINDGLNYLKSRQNSDGGIQGFAGLNPWAMMAFSSAGKNNDSLLNYLASHPPANDIPPTDWGKYILAITSAGKDPFNFGNINYEAKLESFHNNGQLGSTSQINDDIFGLLALIASGKSASDSVKQDSLHFIISHQNNDGGYSWSTTGTSDTDDTASALQALLAAQNNGMTDSGLTNSIAKAKTFLLSEQKNDGGFVSTSSDSESNTATTSWSVMALYALGMGSDDRTKKAQNFIVRIQQENGSFAYQSASTGETFTTSYALPALEGKSWPLAIANQNITGTPTLTPTVTLTPTSTPTPTSTRNSTVNSATPETSPTPTQVTPTITQTANLNNKLSFVNIFQSTENNLRKNIINISRQNIIVMQIQELFQTLGKQFRMLFFR